MKTVGKPVRKKDAMQLLTGQPLYTDDIAPRDCLIVKLLRSPHASAVIRSIRRDIALKVPGIEATLGVQVPHEGRHAVVVLDPAFEVVPDLRLGVVSSQCHVVASLIVVKV